jgi:N-acetylmuramoyl-L-alanine amidase
LNHKKQKYRIGALLLLASGIFFLAFSNASGKRIYKGKDTGIDNTETNLPASADQEADTNPTGTADDTSSRAVSDNSSIATNGDFPDASDGKSSNASDDTSLEASTGNAFETSGDKASEVSGGTSDSPDSDRIDSKHTAKDNIDKVDDKPGKTVIEEVDKEDTAKKKMIAIDAGHQSKGNYEKEPIGPGASITKPKVSSGTKGIATGVYEYELTLTIAKKLKKELVKRGYEVFMVRESHKVNYSNKERAEMANESGADIFIRIHADGSENSKAYGASTLYPSKDNPYVPELSADSKLLSQKIVASLSDRTGTKNRGAIARDDMSGINWCGIPVSIIEMGFMTNDKEDKLMQTKEYQKKIVKGICDGIEDYFGESEA